MFKLHKLLFILPALSLGTSAAGLTPTGPSAPSAAANPGSTSPWELTAAGGLGLSRGNVDSLTYSLQFLSTYVTPTVDAYFGVDHFYGETEGVTTAESVRIFGNINRQISELWHIGLGADYLTDSVADIDYRFSLLPKVGVHLWKNDRSRFLIEAGPGYVWEDQGGTRDYSVIYFGQRYEHQINERVKLWQSLSYLPEAGDFSNHLLIAEVGLQTLLTNHLALRFMARDTYDGTPAAGRKSNDLALITSLSWSPGGFAPEPLVPRRTLKPAIVAPAPPKEGWTTTGALGLTLTKGNSDNLALTATLDSAYRKGVHEFLGVVNGIYGEATGATNADSLIASAIYNRMLNDSFYAGLGASFQHNGRADLSYRFTPGLHLGTYLARTDRLKISLQAGPGWVFQREGGVSDSYFAILAGQKLEWKINDTFSIGESVTYTAEGGDLNNSFLISTAYLDTALTDRVSFRFSVLSNYDNEPAAGLKKHDLMVSSGVAVKF